MHIFNKAFLLIVSISLFGCASAPITIIQTKDGILQNEQAVAVEQSSAGATLLGGAIGGLVGNQIGGGSGKKVATAAGAVGGAAIANQASKKQVMHYSYTIRFDDGSSMQWNTKTDRKANNQKVRVEFLSNGRQRVHPLY